MKINGFSIWRNHLTTLIEYINIKFAQCASLISHIIIVMIMERFSYLYFQLKKKKLIL